jgi:hypothetical protein
MRLYNIKGRLVHKNVARFRIDWEGECKSKIQFRTKQFFKPYWLGCICYEEFPVYGSLMKVDLLNATYRIAVEVNGPQHSQLHYFHNHEPIQYLASIKRDVQKTEWLEKNNFKLIEVNFDEIDKLSPEFIKEKFQISL